jgi:predicted transcriptional regulator
MSVTSTPGVTCANLCEPLADTRCTRIIASSTTTVTVRLPPEVKDRLDLLAERTRRIRSLLAGEATAGYVAHDLAIIEGIHEGLDDLRAGRVVEHDQVMAEVRSIIEDAEKARQ